MSTLKHKVSDPEVVEHKVKVGHKARWGEKGFREPGNEDRKVSRVKRNILLDGEQFSISRNHYL